MKAAVLTQLGTSPIYKDFPDPVPQNDEQLLVKIKAASVKNLDKGRASGRHYGSYTSLPVVVGLDGAGELEDGTRVYAIGVNGMIAEKGLVDKNRYVVLPDKVDFITAAALPNAVLGAAMALLFRGNMQKGNVVLINGATGVTGQLAVQVAKHYRASKIIVTGRNQELLEKAKLLGANTIISLKQGDEAIIKQLKEIHSVHPIDVVIDYLWGHPTELIISTLKGGGVNTFTNKVRIVSVGSMAGENITLPSSILRSSAIEFVGSGLGSLSHDDLKKFRTTILPEMFQLAADGKLTIDTVTAPLSEIETAWTKHIEPGKRLVITI